MITDLFGSENQNTLIKIDCSVNFMLRQNAFDFTRYVQGQSLILTDLDLEQAHNSTNQLIQTQAMPMPWLLASE